jgi:hypothetical protein
MISQVFYRMTYVSKEEKTLPCVRRSNVCVTNCIVWNPIAEVVFCLPLIYHLENGRVNQSMLIQWEDPVDVVLCGLYMGRLKIRILTC